MDTSSWKWFRYDEIFDIKSFHGDTLQDLEEGNIPYISATEDNNGVNGYIDSDIFCEGNKITVSRNGSVGVSFYQPNKFYPSPDDVRIFALKDFLLTPYIAMFLCVLIEKEKYRYTYGRKFGTNRMKASLIKLPVTPEGLPDWQYMEDFVKDTIIPQLPKKAQKVWLKKYETKPLLDMKPLLNTQDWKWFKINQFCEKPYKAKAYNANELIECSPDNKDAILYVTRTDVNNGCKGFVINDGFDAVEAGSAITIGDTTSTIYYQAKDFICGDHIVVLRSNHFNIYTGLFITALLNRERYRYNYGRAFTMDIIEQTKLKLPSITNSEGEDIPDWQFMEDYIKSLPYSKNLKPSDPNEVVDELIEVKKEMIKLRHELKAHQEAQEVKIVGGNVTYIDNSTNYNIKK